jgi:hypothetical protein
MPGPVFRRGDWVTLRTFVVGVSTNSGTACWGASGPGVRRPTERPPNAELCGRFACVSHEFTRLHPR